MMDFKIISLNVNHSQNLGGLLTYIVSERPTVVLLQEVLQDSEELELLVTRHGYKAFSSLSVDSNPGVGFIYLLNLPVRDIHILEPGRLVSMEMEGDEFPPIFNLYAPSGSGARDSRRNFYGETILRNLRLRTNLPLIMGDFNCVISRIDTTENFNIKKCDALSELVRLFQYTDGFRKLHPNEIEFTFSRPYMSPSRLDRVYLPPRWEGKVISVSHFPTLSDHKGVLITLEGTPPPRDPKPPTPYWKLNVLVLQDPDFLERFTILWEKLVDGLDESKPISLWWEEEGKPEIRRFLQRISKERACGRRSTKLYLFHKLDKALKSSNWELISYLRGRLKTMFQEDLQGFIIRSRAQEYAEEEKGSLYHVNREVKLGNSTNLSSLMIDGRVCSDKEEVEKEIFNFYGPLFRGQHRSVDGYTEPVDTGTPFKPDEEQVQGFLEGLGELSPDQQLHIQQPISLEELGSALETCSKNKSPGLDGLSYEFYQRTAQVIGPVLIQIFQDQLNSGDLIKSNRQGVTRLISKVQGVPTINQVRPITLLSCDYKIMSKIIASRLNSVIPSVINSRQLCTNPPKSILNGALNIISGIDYINTKQIPAYLVSFDIYKAYDKANVTFICTVLKAMKFPDKFIDYIRVMHHNINTCFIVGNLTGKLPVGVSLRQGDPSAMPLYLVNQEPFLVYINRGMVGLSMAGLTQKDEDYVDDISGLSTDPRDLLFLDEAFKKFEAASGTVLNRSQKSKIMGLGGWAGRDVWPLPWLRTEDSLRIFGVQFMPRVGDTIAASWSRCLEGFRKCLLSWSSRMLPTLQQRVFVLNTFALSKLWYLAQVLPLPRNILLELEKVSRKFLWLGRLEHLPFEELHAPLLEGGLGLPNIQAKCDALFLKQTCRFLAAPTPSRLHLAYWVGLQLRFHLPDLYRGLNAEILSPYFKHVICLLKEGFNLDLISPEELGDVTTKSLYWGFMSTPPPPRIVTRFPTLPWPLIYQRLSSPVLSPAARDLLFTIINNIYPNGQRLNRLNQASGNCRHCRVEEDNTHLFMECQYSLPVWNWVRSHIVGLKPELGGDSNQLFLSLAHSRSNRENVVLFLVSNFLLYVHERRKLSEFVSLIKFKGYIAHCYQNYVNEKHPNLGILNL